MGGRADGTYGDVMSTIEDAAEFVRTLTLRMLDEQTDDRDGTADPEVVRMRKAFFDEQGPVIESSWHPVCVPGDDASYDEASCDAIDEVFGMLPGHLMFAYGLDEQQAEAVCEGWDSSRTHRALAETDEHAQPREMARRGFVGAYLDAHPGPGRLTAANAAFSARWPE